MELDARTPTVPSRALLPLRAFLGFTFCFAGLQKLANPGFFRASDPGSIQAQLAGSARLSPVHALISPLTHVAVPLGLVIAVAELAIGLGTVLGLWQRLAAAGGVALSLLLFLTVSFNASPYYTGADIVFVFAWTPLLLAGADPSLSLDALIAARTRARRGSGPVSGSGPAGAGNDSRREVMLKGTATAAVAVGGLALGGATAGLGRLADGTSGGSSPAALSSPLASPTSSGQPSSSAKPSPSQSGSGESGSVSGSGKQGTGGHPAGTAIGAASVVPVGGSASFNDPGTGDPSLVIQPTAGKFLAFDAVCPHAGCAVGYDRSARIFSCPCHGSEFNATTGAVEAGPASTGLTPIPVAKASDGQLYAT
jgi:thiosulfate dehydrogenase [quinone] large subunit